MKLHLLIIPNVQETIFSRTSKYRWFVWRPLNKTSCYWHILQYNDNIYIMPKGMKSYQKTKITWTQRTAALWPSNLWIGDPTPLEVRLRRSNMRTELSADLERYGDKLNVDVMLCHPAHKDMTWISRQKCSSYPVRIRLSSWGFQSTQWRSALWAFSTCHQIHGREEN